jgi:hypothetical protein
MANLSKTVPFGEDNCLEILPDDEETSKKWTDVESNPIHLIGEEASIPSSH